jgi:dephospho-CoA kinase
MLRVALTGGIATGKTYCLAGFAKRGAPVVDADQVAREVVRPGSAALAAIVRRFGAEILTPTGELDRARLAARVFAEPEARLALEAIVHPEVYRRIRDWFASLERAGTHALGIADIPLLYETRHEQEFDRVVVAACAPATQRARLRARSGLSEAEIDARLAAQWPIDLKRARAHYVISTEGSFADTDREIERVWRALCRDAGLDERSS